jgi:septal ring factor EnvC (AmiA/AmiB activator)
MSNKSMDLKAIQAQLESLRNRIRAEGRISTSCEQELKSILENTIQTANHELTDIQNKLTATMAMRAGNDNQTPLLSDDQKKRLSILEKTGTGSTVLH